MIKIPCQATTEISEACHDVYSSIPSSTEGLPIPKATQPTDESKPMRTNQQLYSTLRHVPIKLLCRQHLSMPIYVLHFPSLLRFFSQNQSAVLPMTVLSNLEGLGKQHHGAIKCFVFSFAPQLCVLEGENQIPCSPLLCTRNRALMALIRWGRMFGGRWIR